MSNSHVVAKCYCSKISIASLFPSFHSVCFADSGGGIRTSARRHLLWKSDRYHQKVISLTVLTIQKLSRNTSYVQTFTMQNIHWEEGLQNNSNLEKCWCTISNNDHWKPWSVQEEAVRYIYLKYYTTTIMMDIKGSVSTYKTGTIWS